MVEGTGGWYVRASGRVLGPFSLPQLTSMRDRGQLLQAHELSQDRRSWVKATDLPGLYKPAVQSPAAAAGAGVEWPAGPGGDPASAAAQTAPCWFVARGETHHGPLQAADLQRMIDAGELGPNSLIWKNGLADWVPASQVSGLWFGTAAGPSAAIPAAASHPTPTTSSPAYPQQPAQISALAVASLVLGLLWLLGIGSLLATIFGAVASSQISRSGGTLTGRGLALAGLILGILGLAVAIGLISFGFVEALLNRARAPG